MLTLKDFWSLVEHIIPIYVIIVGGYVLTKYKMILPVHMPGISRWVSIIGVPAYVIHLLAFNDPYQVSLKLVGADVLQKMVALILGMLWWRFTKTGSIDSTIDFFMLATLPNTVLVGTALLEPLYGVGVQVNVTTIIFLQSILWYNLCIALYELRTVLIGLKLRNVGQPSAQLEKATGDFAIVTVIGLRDAPAGGDELLPVSDSPAIKRTLSAPARVSFSKVVPITFGSPVSEDEFEGDRVSIQDSFSINLDVDAEFEGSRSRNLKVGVVELVDEKVGDSTTVEPSMNNLVFALQVSYKVLNRIKYAPLTYGSVIGFVYSLLAFKYDWTMPYYVQTSLELISQGAVGMATFLLGMTWANSGRMISCGVRTMTLGMLIRFVCSPLIMVVTSLVLGLRGDIFRFAILQAVIPQGVISFVLAKEYNLHADVFATAVIFQLLVFLPVAIAYYFVLDSL